MPGHRIVGRVLTDSAEHLAHVFLYYGVRDSLVPVLEGGCRGLEVAGLCVDIYFYIYLFVCFYVYMFVYLEEGRYQYGGYMLC